MKERRMVSSVSSSITSALNMGYGIDSSSIVSGLVSAVRDPKDKALSAKESKVGAQISAIANASAALNNFATALTQLLSTSEYSGKPASSDTSIAERKSVDEGKRVSVRVDFEGRGVIKKKKKA